MRRGERGRGFFELNSGGGLRRRGGGGVVILWKKKDEDFWGGKKKGCFWRRGAYCERNIQIGERRRREKKKEGGEIIGNVTSSIEKKRGRIPQLSSYGRGEKINPYPVSSS